MKVGVLASLALGALQTLAYVHTAWWPLPILCLAGLAWQWQRASPRRAALLGWCFGLGWLCAGVWWLFISMHRYGGLPAPLAAAAVVALSAALSLYWAAAGAAFARWRRGSGADTLLFAALCLLAELARGVFFTGFPWLALGYSQVDGPLAALAPWLGVYGMGAVMAMLAALSAVLLAFLLTALLARRWPQQWRQPPGRAGSSVVSGFTAGLAAAVLGLAALAVTGPGRFTQSTGELSVALLQSNVPQDQKFAAEAIVKTLVWVRDELLGAQADLVVSPETAVPLLPSQLQEMAPGYWETLQAHFAARPGAALVGVPMGDFDSGYTNSVAGLSAAGPYRYNKLHLVPFGEFIPTGFRWFTELMNIPLGDFARGVPNPPSLPLRGQRLAPNICYEDLFGEELALRFVDPALSPTVLVNISNMGWFGDSEAIAQHLNISRLRALELQRPMLRATNTGATAIIDHQGRVTALLEPHTQGVLTGTVQGRQGVTPFAWWAGRFGLWPLWALAILTVLAFAWRRKAR